jgi:hypothetical protein
MNSSMLNELKSTLTNEYKKIQDRFNLYEYKMGIINQEFNKQDETQLMVHQNSKEYVLREFNIEKKKLLDELSDITSSMAEIGNINDANVDTFVDNFFNDGPDNYENANMVKALMDKKNKLISNANDAREKILNERELMKSGSNVYDISLLGDYTNNFNFDGSASNVDTSTQSGSLINSYVNEIKKLLLTDFSSKKAKKISEINSIKDNISEKQKIGDEIRMEINDLTARKTNRIETSERLQSYLNNYKVLIRGGVIFQDTTNTEPESYNRFYKLGSSNKVIHDNGESGNAVNISNYLSFEATLPKWYTLTNSIRLINVFNGENKIIDGQEIADVIKIFETSENVLSTGPYNNGTIILGVDRFNTIKNKTENPMDDYSRNIGIELLQIIDKPLEQKTQIEQDTCLRNNIGEQICNSNNNIYVSSNTMKQIIWGLIRKLDVLIERNSLEISSKINNTKKSVKKLKQDIDTNITSFNTLEESTGESLVRLNAAGDIANKEKKNNMGICDGDNCNYSNNNATGEITDGVKNINNLANTAVTTYALNKNARNVELAGLDFDRLLSIDKNEHIHNREFSGIHTLLDNKGISSH